MSRFSCPRDAARAILAPNTHPYGLWSLCCSFYSRPSFAAEIQLLWVHQTQQHHPPGKHFWKKSAGGGVAARCQRQHGATEHPLSPPPAEVPPPPSPNLPSRPLSSHGRGAGPGSAPPAGTRGAGRGGGAGGVRSGCGTARSGRRCGEWGCPRVGGSRRCARVRSVRAVPTVSAALRVRSASGVSDRAVLSLLCCRCALTARPAAWGRVGTAKQRGARGGGQQLLSERKGGEKRKNQVLAAITTCTYT